MGKVKMNTKGKTTRKITIERMNTRKINTKGMTTRKTITSKNKPTKNYDLSPQYY